jgi:hypothetical protein
MVWKDATSFKKTENAPYDDGRSSKLYVLLPIPSFIGDKIKSLMMKDQNIEIVNDPAKADYGIYLNYGRDKVSDPSMAIDEDIGFKIYIHPTITGKLYMMNELFSQERISVPRLETGNATKISRELYDYLRTLIRIKTNRWMNTYPRR